MDAGTEQPVQSTQILSLIELSEKCEQEFHYECNLAPLSDNGVDYAFWEDRHGDKNTYFTGG